MFLFNRLCSFILIEKEKRSRECVCVIWVVWDGSGGGGGGGGGGGDKILGADKAGNSSQKIIMIIMQ